MQMWKGVWYIDNLQMSSFQALRPVFTSEKQGLQVLKLCCVAKNIPDQPHYHMSFDFQVKSSTAW
jgi:hypothetical protein